MKQFFKPLEQLSGYVGVILGAGITITSFTGVLLDPVKRIGVVAATAILFLFAYLRKPIDSSGKKSQIIGPDNQPLSKESSRERHWLILCVFCASIVVIDLVIQLTGTSDKVIVDGPYFEYPTTGNYEPWPFSRPRDDEFFDPGMPDEGFASPVVEEGNDELAVYRDRQDIDNSELVTTIARDNLPYLYISPLGEHFRFSVYKTEQASKVVIEDIRVKVLKYEPIPDAGAGGAAGAYNNFIAVVELEPRDSPLPWEFSPTYLLSNPSNRAVDLWRQKQIVLDDDIPLTFLVKIGAKTSGIYTYSAMLVIRDNIGTRQQIVVIPDSQPRTCMFEGGTLMENTDVVPPIQEQTEQ